VPFPETKYMGSKQSLLPWIMEHLSRLDYNTALDAFSGSGCVAYAMKEAGKTVTANDFLRFAYHTARATVENNHARLSPADVDLLLRPNPDAPRFIADNFADLYFPEEDCVFLDEAYANLRILECEYKRSLALAALCRACMKKRPRGIFTFTGRKGWDGRRDLTLSMREQFLEAVELLNAAVIDNGRENRATCLDVFDTSTEGVELVYIDTPYLSPYSDADYTRRYHFLEGLCSYWRDVEIQRRTSTRKIASYPTAFRTVRTGEDAFDRLFRHFQQCRIIVVSYSSNGVPTRDEMTRLLKPYKRKVRVEEIPHKYCFGNHRHKVGDNNNDVTEYLFIAQ